VLKIAREIFTTGTLSGQIIVSYKALKVKANSPTAVLLISAASYTNWMGYVLLTEMTLLFSFKECQWVIRRNSNEPNRNMAQ